MPFCIFPPSNFLVVLQDFIVLDLFVFVLQYFVVFAAVCSCCVFQKKAFNTFLILQELNLNDVKTESNGAVVYSTWLASQKLCHTWQIVNSLLHLHSTNANYWLLPHSLCLEDEYVLFFSNMQHVEKGIIVDKNFIDDVIITAGVWASVYCIFVQLWSICSLSDFVASWNTASCKSHRVIFV